MLVKTDGILGGKPAGKRTEKRKDKCFLFKNMRGEIKIEEDERSCQVDGPCKEEEARKILEKEMLIEA